MSHPKTLASILVLLATASCAPRDRTPLRIVDLIRELPSAEARPARAAFEVIDFPGPGRAYPAIRTLAPSRLVYTLPMPRRGVLTARILIDASEGGPPPQPLRFRIGISDDRIYETISDVVLTPGVQAEWVALRADLSAYAGWKWSIFYRPDRVRWRLILGTDAATGIPARGVWGVPAIESDRAAAREYVERAARGR